MRGRNASAVRRRGRHVRLPRAITEAVSLLQWWIPYGGRHMHEFCDKLYIVFWTQVLHCRPNRSLHLLRLALVRPAEQPHPNEDQPSGNSDSNTRNPGVCTADDEAPRPLVVSKVPHGHCPLLEYVGQEWPLIIDQKVEDAVLVRQGEGSAEYGAARRLRSRLESQAVKGRQHAEFELDGLAGCRDKGHKMINFPFGELDQERLPLVSTDHVVEAGWPLTTSFLIL